MVSNFPVGTVSPDEDAAFWQTYVPSWRQQTEIDKKSICRAFPSMEPESILLLIEDLRREGVTRITNGVISDEIRGVDPLEECPLQEQP